jgi:hypothetical protein
MNTRALLFLFVAVVGLGQAVSDRGSGALTTDIDVIILEEASKLPIAGVTVVYYNEGDESLREEIAARKKRGLLHFPAAPKGISSVTGADGRTRLRCRISASWVTDNPGGPKKEECFPDGAFEVSHPDFRTTEIEARRLYPAPPYAQPIPAATIYLKKKANESREPTATAVMPAAEQPPRQP